MEKSILGKYLLYFAIFFGVILYVPAWYDQGAQLRFGIAAAGLALFLLFTTHQIYVSKRAATLLALVLIVPFVPGAFVAINMGDWLWDWCRFTFFISLLLVIIYKANDLWNKNVFLVIYLIVLTVTLFTGVFENNGSFGSAGLMFNPNLNAATMLSLLPWVMWSLYSATKNKIALVALLLASAFAIYFTKSFLMLGLFPVVIFTTLWFLQGDKRFRLVAILCLVSVLASFAHYHAFFWGSFQARGVYWQKSLLMFKDYPWFGVGGEQWYAHIGAYGLGNTAAKMGKIYFIQPHNEGIRFLVEYGLWGIAALALALFLVFRQMKTFDQKKKIALVAISVWLIDAMFNFPSQFSASIVVLAFLASALFTPSLGKINIRFTLIALLSLVGLVSGLKFYNGHIFSKTKRFDNMGNTAQAAIYTQKVNPFWYTTDVSSGEPTASLLGIYALKSGDNSQALKWFNIAVGQAPYHPLAFARRANYFAALNELQKANADYSTCVAITPCFIDVIVDWSVLYYRQKNPKKALEILNKVCSDNATTTKYKEIYQAEIDLLQR